MEFTIINPATESIQDNYNELSKSEIIRCIESGHQAYLKWKKTSFTNRKEKMLSLASLLRKNKEKYAKQMANEMGKPITQGLGEIEKSAWVCEYYAQEAEGFLKPRMIDTNMLKTKVCYQPIGVIFAIMPWNFPFWQVFRFAAPNIMAGNVAILKHAPICFGCGETIAELFIEAGFPKGIFQNFILGNDSASLVIENEHIKGVTLTGSEKAGKEVGAYAASHLKKVVLELGGSDPYVILDDANIESAAENIVTSRMNNSGQVCIAAKRTIVVKSKHDELLEYLSQKIKRYKMGDPLITQTNFGPMARKDLRDMVHQQVIASIQKGAHLYCGGVVPQKKGFYYPPTILTAVKPGMPAFDEEIFGPVIAVIKATDEQHAIELANQTSYGLGAAVFTQDLEKGERFATDEILAGSCFVNSFVASDPRVPFGGIKHSGYGRELSKEGILEFINVKSVSVQKS